MVSVKDIAAECKVSVATVSKALNGYSDISEVTRRMIKEKAAEMGYLPNMAAVALKTKRTYNIGVLFADAANSGLTNEYFATVLQGARAEAESRGYSITFITNRFGNKKITYSEFCRNRQFDGVIIACIDFNDPQVVELVKSGIPIVTIDHVFNNTLAVMSDNVKGVRDLVEYLYSMGHRKIAYIHGGDSSVTHDRLTSFYRCVERLELDIPTEYIMECKYRDTNKAARCTKKLLDLKDRPTCILYPDDFTAIGGINLIESRGLRIPDDISVVGYDGISYTKIHEPTITTLLQGATEMGTTAAGKLIELIEHPKTTLRETYVIEGNVLIGESVKDINSKRKNV
ncbi:MAG: LacI family transcriptional regulator [Lachnospiraceae bacterium]|nr:LacI family transcriptional regulator [Lachnospiraceae bacterium]